MPLFSRLICVCFFYYRHFACLSKGDVIAINYNKKIYELNVLETKPANAVSIIECDMNVEFEAPPGYVVIFF